MSFKREKKRRGDGFREMSIQEKRREEEMADA